MVLLLDLMENLILKQKRQIVFFKQEMFILAGDSHASLTMVFDHQWL